MTTALVAAPYPRGNCNLKRNCDFYARVNIGASGAPTVVFGPEGFTLSGGGADGVYTGTMPTGDRGVGFAQIFEATPLGKFVSFSAFDAAAGTFSIVVNHGDLTAVGEDPADGDALFFHFAIEGG